MARARNIKPGFFTNDELSTLPPETRLFFIGLWTLADREGRLQDRPKKIKAEVFPYDDYDVDAMIGALATHGFLIRYTVDGISCIEIVNFLKHQRPHYNEAKSVLPSREQAGNKQGTSKTTKVASPSNQGDKGFARIPDTGYLNEDTGLLNAEVATTAKSGTRLSPDSTLTDDWLHEAHAIAEQANVQATDQSILWEFGKFRDYWVARPGKEGLKLDWLATWRGWCRRAVTDLGKTTPTARTRENTLNRDVAYAKTMQLLNGGKS